MEKDEQTLLEKWPNSAIKVITPFMVVLLNFELFIHNILFHILHYLLVPQWSDKDMGNQRSEHLLIRQFTHKI